MPDPQYRFRLNGQLSADLLASFQPLRSEVEGGRTTFTRGVHDGAELFGIIARCEVLGLELIGLERMGAPLAQGPGMG